MFKDDVSEVSDGCAYWQGNLLTVYDGSIARDYRLNGRKWTLVDMYSDTTMPAVCFDVASLDSSAKYEPVYGFIVGCSAVLVFALIWRILGGLFSGGRV